jgi:hypothetical protein
MSKDAFASPIHMRVTSHAHDKLAMKMIKSIFCVLYGTLRKNENFNLQSQTQRSRSIDSPHSLKSLRVKFIQIVSQLRSQNHL